MSTNLTELWSEVNRPGLHCPRHGVGLEINPSLLSGCVRALILMQTLELHLETNGKEAVRRPILLYNSKVAD